VELESGEFVFFDSHEEEIKVEHIISSAALPPGFPPVKINGKYYVDGGVFSNTPLSKIIDEFADSEKHIRNVLCFMVDLFSLKGPLPHSLDGLMERIKDIRYSSHAKRANALYATTQNLSHAIHFLASKLTPEQQQDPHVQEIMKLGYAHRLDIIHLVYHSEKGTELESKDYEFSAESATKHRQMGYLNTLNMIKEEEQDWLRLHRSGVTVYTLEATKAARHKV
jgi:NTE family protein